MSVLAEIPVRHRIISTCANCRGTSLLTHLGWDGKHICSACAITRSQSRSHGHLRAALVHLHLALDFHRQFSRSAGAPLAKLYHALSRLTPSYGSNTLPTEDEIRAAAEQFAGKSL